MRYVSPYNRKDVKPSVFVPDYLSRDIYVFYLSYPKDNQLKQISEELRSGNKRAPSAYRNEGLSSEKEPEGRVNCPVAVW